MQSNRKHFDTVIYYFRLNPGIDYPVMGSRRPPHFKYVNTVRARRVYKVYHTVTDHREQFFKVSLRHNLSLTLCVSSVSTKFKLLKARLSKVECLYE